MMFDKCYIGVNKEGLTVVTATLDSSVWNCLKIFDKCYIEVNKEGLTNGNAPLETDSMIGSSNNNTRDNFKRERLSFYSNSF